MTCIIDKLVSLKAPECNKDELLEFHTSYTSLLHQLESYVVDIKVVNGNKSYDSEEITGYFFASTYMIVITGTSLQRGTDF